MKTIEFETVLTGGDSLPLPPQIAAALPTSGTARIVVLVESDPDDSLWQQDVIQQFLSDDSPEDASYDRYL